MNILPSKPKGKKKKSGDQIEGISLPGIRVTSETLQEKLGMHYFSKHLTRMRTETNTYQG
jgi:hypothetical protein